MATRYFEDLSVGETCECGSRTITEDELLWFAREYDPQPFHVDPDAAAETMYGGLIASGWHTIAVCNRLIMDGYFEEVAAIGGRGVQEIRWPAPVRPGDELTARLRIGGKSDDTRPERGLIRVPVTATVDGVPVLEMTLRTLVLRRSET